MSAQVLVKSLSRGYFAIIVLLLFVFPVPAEAQSFTVSPLVTGAEQSRKAVKPFSPVFYFRDYISAYKAQEAAKPYWVASETEINAQTKNLSENVSILLNDDILAFYGHPLSRNMGILGRYSIEELDDRLTKLAAEYKAVSGGRDVLRAFYIIFGTVWPQGDIGIIQEPVLLDYIQYALDHDILIFIDHQIGRYDPVESLKRMFPYLKFPNVHLALDPEWRTTKPMQEIGSITGDEINRAQQVMEEYMVEHEIPGERMLVIHQFNWRMIREREKVQAGSDSVKLIHCADGFGNPSIKRQSYAYNAQAVNMPLKGFKLFYNFGIPGAGYDEPLISPSEVYALNPRPYLIIYQ